MPAPLTPEEARRKAAEAQARAAEARARAAAAFPFERVEVTGEMALSKWEELKTSGRGAPIVLGDDESLARLMEPFSERRPEKKSVAEILAAADRIRHPEDLVAHHSRERARSVEQLKQYLDTQPNAPLPQMSVLDAQGNRRQLTPEEARAAVLQSFDKAPEIGEWPTEVPPAPGLSVAMDLRTGQAAQRVHIALIPTDDWTTTPAHLRWGGWNECPAAEYHVAALRSWRDRFGIELVGMNPDTLNLRAARSPQTRTEALELAHEQYVYCNDIVDQGVGTISALAASLMADPWWYFWWD
jgi:hypothetical protein